MSNKYDYKRATARINGRQIEARGKTLPEAHRKLAKKIAAIESGDMGISGKMTVERWCEEWFNTYKKGKVGKSTEDDYKYRLDKIIIPFIGNKKLREINLIHLQKIIDSRDGNSKSDVDKTFNTINSLFKKAKHARLIPFNPAEGLVKPPAQDGKRRALTERERKQVLKLAKTHFAGTWIKLMLYCGLRPSETIALYWRHIDFKNKLVKVEQANDKSTNEIKVTKTPAGKRYIPIPDGLLEELREQKRGPFDPVFTQQLSNKRHTVSSLRKYWLNFKRELDESMGKIKEVTTPLTPYCFRHTFCTDLQTKGIEIGWAAYLMGHEDINVTKRIYTHTSKEDVIKLGEKISKSNNNKKSRYRIVLRFAGKCAGNKDDVV